jgi:Mg2+ and Co2+ transporter CorA
MAIASKQDSSAMKIIALLTTFFLPGTFIAVSTGIITAMIPQADTAN